jgi:GNAT superfamily N-acetyltransferase
MATDPQFTISRLDPDKHRRGEFTCEIPELATFIQQRANREGRLFASACFVLAPVDDPGRIAGYYTLTNASILLTKIPPNLAKKLPSYPEMGATLIGRMARALDYKGKDIGGLLLADALERSLITAAQAGSVAVVVDPKNEKAARFYERNGFRWIDEKRMFIPMASLKNWKAKGWQA